MDDLTTTQVARKLKVSRIWVAELCKRGEFKGARYEKALGRWLIPRQAVENWQPLKMGRPKKTK